MDRRGKFNAVVRIKRIPRGLCVASGSALANHKLASPVVPVPKNESLYKSQVAAEWIEFRTRHPTRPVLRYPSWGRGHGPTSVLDGGGVICRRMCAGGTE